MGSSPNHRPHFLVGARLGPVSRNLQLGGFPVAVGRLSETLATYDLVVKRYNQMKQGIDIFDPYTGPISDNTGKLQIKAGEVASKGDLLSIMYYVDNIAGSIPK